MKFLCDQCKAKYQISDEKVAGKTVRMKCRKCGHQIEVRAAVTESSVSTSLPPPGDSLPPAGMTGGGNGAGAGGAAHLPGMVAAYTTLPVIGVPVKSSNSIDGWDSVLSILQMPGGVPVATVALNGAKNAGLLAAQILATNDEILSQKLEDYKKKMEEDVMRMAEDI